MTTATHADWGVILAETDVDRAIMVSLATWLPTYLRQLERSRALPGHLLARPRPESFQNTLEDTEFPDGQLPAILVTTAQTQGEPGRRNHFDYAAAFQVAVSCVVRGRTPAETRECAALFGAAVRAILIQQQINLEGETVWVGSQVVPVPDQTDTGRYLAAGVNSFIVYADNVITGEGPISYDPDGPLPPDDPDDPYDPLVVVTDVMTTITARS